MQKSASGGSHGNELIFSGDFGSDRQCDDVIDDAEDDVTDDVIDDAEDDVIDDVIDDAEEGARCVEEGQPSDSLVLPYAHLSTVQPPYVVVLKE